MLSTADGIVQAMVAAGAPGWQTGLFYGIQIGLRSPVDPHFDSSGHTGCAADGFLRGQKKEICIN